MRVCRCSGTCVHMCPHAMFVRSCVVVCACRHRCGCCCICVRNVVAEHRSLCACLSARHTQCVSATGMHPAMCACSLQRMLVTLSGVPVCAMRCSVLKCVLQSCSLLCDCACVGACMCARACLRVSVCGCVRVCTCGRAPHARAGVWCTRGCACMPECMLLMFRTARASRHLGGITRMRGRVCLAFGRAEVLKSSVFACWSASICACWSASICACVHAIMRVHASVRGVDA
jgi:hypothetical protein